MKRLILAASLIVLLISFAFAADFWTKKPYTQWSSKDVNRLLSESPWAKTFSMRRAVLQAARRNFGTPSNLPGEGTGENDPGMDYVVYLRTAQPVREALVRQAQLEKKYDQLDDAARRAFDAQWDQFLASTYPDKVIFQVKYSANTPDVDRNLAYFWQTRTLDAIQNECFMTGPDGKRVSPTAYWVGKGALREFQLAFPRPQGLPAEDAGLSVEFRSPDLLGWNENRTGNPRAITVGGPIRVYVKFSLKEMTYKGALTY